ncbi:uncharacterized protein LOC106063981 isoform X1 [Biomphalaria glabrata]|uniref:Uncharacterized protein LOC106063981 isoform X1 n=1 Tax=Biomphalaria glabrata TaxID=6526 RepID=A0A9W3ACV1_BIOGL|nr:uncharacterized protein LOC106063981 isoform X1 [Biomphalaria glabrata]
MSLAKYFKVVCLAMMVVDTFQQGCEKNFFGNKCRFMCRCDNNRCQTDGSCDKGQSCTQPYFGHLCQYVSLTDSAEAPQRFPCSTDPTKVVFTIKLKETILFTFLGVQFDEFLLLPLMYRRNNVSLNFKLGQVTIDCFKKEIWEISDSYVELRCSNQFLFDQVILSGSGVGYICRVFVSGGRNVARSLFSPQEGQSGDLFYNQRMLILDGETGDRSQCPKIKRTDKLLHWMWPSDTSSPFRIHRIILYTASGAKRQMSGLSIKLTSAKSTSLQNVTYADDNKHVMTLSSQSDATSLAILLKGQDFISLCELEVYGDCMSGKSGLDCSSTCSHCNSGRCHVSGQCLGCVTEFGITVCRPICSKCPSDTNCNGECKSECTLGYTGPDCLQSCLNCGGAGACDKDTGQCKENCIDGFRGLNCHDKCWNCAGNGDCNRYNGSCHSGCTTGYRGDACFLNCGHCGGTRSCDRYTGVCSSSCLPGYKGEDCSQECTNCVRRNCSGLKGTCVNGCIDGYFGDDCEQECVNCAGSKECHQKTGVCTEGCASGFYQESCTEECLHCGGRGFCHRETGECSEGCVPDFHGNRCDTRENEISSFDFKVFLNYAAFVLMIFMALAAIFFARDYCVFCRLPTRQSLDLLNPPKTVTSKGRAATVEDVANSEESSGSYSGRSETSLATPSVKPSAKRLSSF